MSIAIDLRGKIALITGASGGIGAATTRLLHRAGATVAINHPGPSDSDPCRDAHALARELNAERSESAEIYQADVRDGIEVELMMASIHRTLGGLDLLVNNAGILRDRSIAKMTETEWQDVIDVNLTGVFHCCKYGLEILREEGSIVNVGSLSAQEGFHGQSNYAASKAGVQALTRVLSKECAKRGIRVNAVAPGLIDTHMTASLPDTVRAGMHAMIPLGRPGLADEVAGAILFLCSPLASYISGITLGINGGWRG